MGKKKKSAEEEKFGDGKTEPSTSALIICRNKHWRYISSFHGPWLQLPAEVLESLAHSNYLAPRPQPIDAAVFFDVVKIRRYVDEATTLAVRATSGLSAAAQSSHGHGHGHNSNNHHLNNSLGIGVGVGGGGAGTLSRERKHRMRELATGKLGAAYRLDEIAASVATMQGASTLEDVAQLVLQRNPGDVEAQYVHFFHEKIPSRMLAQCTPLDALDAVIAARPDDGSALRTRALTRIFKDDYANSARDLTAALAAVRSQRGQHLVASRPQPHEHLHSHSHPHSHSRDRLADDDQPSSLETQLLFHRAGVYLALACAHVHPALDGLQAQEEATAAREAQAAAGETPTPETPTHVDARLARAESRRQLRQNAKRALRDYTAFVARFDYTPGISTEVAEEALRRYQAQTQAQTSSHANAHPPANDYQAKLDRLLDESATADALIPYKRPSSTNNNTPWPTLPPPPVFTLNQLFDAVPPPALPPYPLPPDAPPAPMPATESLTYHPLLADALHSLLLVHALLQTPAKELSRHAHNAARLARLLDGYPIFLAARSPARSDWVEVLRRGGNWLGLTCSWESLCRPPVHTEVQNGNTNGALTRTGPNTARPTTTEPPESPLQRRERQKHEAILDALADERVVDEASFQRAVRAREKRFQDDEALSSSSTALSNGTAITNHSEPTLPKRWTKDESEYSISSERADAVARWVRDAPPLTGESGAGRKKRRKAGGKKGRIVEGGKLEDSIASLEIREGE